MCSLRFENNFLTIGHVRFCFENSCLSIEGVCFASKIIFVLSNVFSSFHLRPHLFLIYTLPSCSTPP
jgi:hypothetical protein